MELNIVGIRVNHVKDKEIRDENPVTEMLIYKIHVRYSNLVTLSKD
jgi:hypothetical protein